MGGAQAGKDGAHQDFERQIEAALGKIRSALQADGGDIELLLVVGRDAHVRLTGACIGCSSARFTLQAGVQEFLRREVPGFGAVIDDTPDGGYGWRHDLMETY
ncbi:MAG: NifU family protein [candidate division NC10 bacterium]|nr:NifU family protein [candidate division NC10 bacterium]